MKVVAFVLVALILQVTADPIDFYQECSESGKIQSINIEGCSSNPCPLQRGTTVHMEIKFQSNVDSNSLTAKVFGIIGGATIPWATVPADACAMTTCPLKAGNSYTYTIDLEVLASYPSIPVTVDYHLTDSNQKDVVCFKLPVKLV